MTSTLTSLDADPANRCGRLGPQQVAALTRLAVARRLSLAVSGTALGVLGVVLLGMLLTGALAGAQGWLPAALAFWLAVAAGAAGARGAWLALRPGGDALTRDVREGVVAEVSGPVETGLLEDDEHGAVSWLRIANRRFEVDEELWQAVAPGTVWRGYVLPRSGRLVALEPADRAYPSSAAT